MGIVYLAREVALDRPVALKLLPPSPAADASRRDRFLREARTSARLSHPNILPIHAVDQVGEFVFFTMAYVDGGGDWADVGMAVDSEITLNGQEPGVEFEYRVIAVNKAGEGPASNIVRAVL